MSNSVFPTLDAIRHELPKAPPSSTDWVGLLASSPVAPTPPASGWIPAAMEAVVEQPTVDLELERLQAREAGFRAGFRAGQAAGQERGYVEGHREGLTNGHAEVLTAESARLQEFEAALAATVEQVGPAVDRWRATVEARAAELAMDAVRALLAAELTIRQPEAIGIVREALGHAEGAVRATIRLAPFDRAALAERKDEILAACAGMRDVELVDDRSIQGGCIVETENGVVDATLATRLALLEAA